MTSRPTPTREKILRSAEKLFARDGVDRVTLRQIARASRQRNVAAVQYHFGDKDRLLAEILDRHLTGIDARRRELLDAQECADRIHDIEALLGVLVEPLATKLDDASGRAYLRIQSQRPGLDALRPATRVMAERIARALGRDGPDPLRDRFAVLLLFSALADRVDAEESGQANTIDRRAFVESLTHALHGLYLGAPA